jgi:hypothetical protein
MIKGLHGMFYTPAADEVREFIRTKLRLPLTDTGNSWLVFNLPGADLAVHPSDHPFPSFSFYCDDIFRTVEDLKKRDVEFTTGISEQSWGWITRFRMPGDFEVELFEPKYPQREAKQNAGAKAKSGKTKATSIKRKAKSSKPKAKSLKSKGKSKK